MLSVSVLMLLGVLLGMQLAGSGFQHNSPESVPAMATTESAPEENKPVGSEAAPEQTEIKSRLFLFRPQARCLGQISTRLQWMFWRKNGWTAAKLVKQRHQVGRLSVWRSR